ncbi:hypothetical protein B9Z55_007756 [Caenorhabditis nigoni]|uniref:BTB domain-containing protein n=2 Tax=Caenorhabditis nigoni TaxID=1611254 RepID=A0A2G5VB51_9PELO|nr:hypothetical protein B9Z55_007756 [Caenorhabditis nigoni]
MTKNEEGGNETGENPKIDSPSEMNEVLEKLKLVVAETGEIKNLQKQKFDEFDEKLQSIEESVSKNSVLSNNENKKELKPEKRFVLKHVFENVANFEEYDFNFCQEEEEHFGAKWHMEVKRFGTHLGFYFYCKPIAPVGDKWSIETNIKFIIMDNDGNIAIKAMKNRFKERDDYGYEEFLWEDVEYYLAKNKLTVQVESEILKMTGFEKKRIRKFDESQKDVSDVVLVVEDTKFYVSRMYLAAQSSFFKTLFLGNFSESSKSEIPLSGIDSDDFQDFLEVLYGESAIDDSTIEGILHIADMYATPMVVRKCEDFLLEKSKKPAKKLLEMVARYNLEHLKKKCMSEIKTVADIRAVLPPNTKDLDPRIMAELLDKSLSLH